MSASCSEGASNWAAWPHRRVVLGGLSTLSAIGLAGCALKDESYRYRLSLAVSVGGRSYVGQGVREFVSREVIAFPNIGPVYNQATVGDAIWIESAGGTTLFVLLRQAVYGPGGIWDPTPYLGRGKSSAFTPSAPQGRVAVPLRDFPTIVVFGDPADKSTMQLVLPEQIASVLGGGNARVLGAWVERTSDPVTRGIEAKLPCLAPLMADPKVRGLRVVVPGQLTFNVPDFHA